MHAKFHLDPSNRLATVHERYRQTGQDRQWSDSIGRTVLQTVAQKSDKNKERGGRQCRRSLVKLLLTRLH